MDSPDHFVSLERVINAPAQDLFTAWTDPDVMSEWMGADVTADVRVGGQYRIEAAGPDGQIFVHSGEYIVIEPDTRIVQTFRAGGLEGLEEPLPFSDEFLDIRLQPLGPAQTLLRFVNGWNGDAMSEEAQDAVKAGWSAWLDELESLF
jgi:uncharacterized protein YndB with AHSA1/START domain